MAFAQGSAGSNITVDGNGTSKVQGCGGGPAGTDKTSRPITLSDCGIAVDDSGCKATAANACGFPIVIGTANGSPVTSVTLRYVEWFGNFANNAEQAFLWSYGSNVANVYTIDHVYAHNTGCTYIHQDGGSRSVRNSYFWALDSNSAMCHGEATYDNTTNVDDFNNVYRDIVGSAIHWFDGSRTTHGYFYNNIYWVSTPTPSWVKSNGLAWGILSCANGAKCSNFVFYNVTAVNLQGGYDAGVKDTLDSTCTNCFVRNSIWYGATVPISVLGWNEDHNTFLNSGNNAGNGGAGDIVVPSGAASPFVNWQAGDFHLTSDSANVISGATLPAPFNVDASGITRGVDGVWERGAYEYNATKSTGPAAPTNVVAIVQ
jgi:hypothetical protein